MATSPNRANGGRRQRPWFRSFHRWLGGIAAFFVLLLALTGIALNHGHAWRLDQRYVSWDWLLDAYGLTAPEPSESYAAGNHRLTALGERLYLDEQDVDASVSVLNGAIMLDAMLVVATADSVLLLTPDAELIEQLDLSAVLPGRIQRLGLKEGRAILLSAGQVFVADAAVTGFSIDAQADGSGIDWSDASTPPAELTRTLKTRYRGSGLTLERILADLHSGRILGPAGVYFMDFIALSLIVLSMTGLFQWRRRRNGNGRP